MYREVQACIQRIVQQLSEHNVYVPLPHSTLIEEVHYAAALQFTLNYGNENQNRPFSFRINYRRIRGPHIGNGELQNLIRQAYTDYNLRVDQDLLREVYRTIYNRALHDGQFREIEDKRRHLNDVIDQFYRNQQFQLDRLFTLRDLEAEQEHYNQSQEDTYGVGHHLNFNNQLHFNHPSQPYLQPAPNRELVLERLERAKQVLESYLLGELPGDYYIRQIQKLRDVNRAYERTCRFYNLRPNDLITESPRLRNQTIEALRPGNIPDAVATNYQRLLQAHRMDIHDLYVGNFGWDVGGPDYQAPRSKAEERGEKLLLENLTEEQKKCYHQNQYFIVKGGKTGKSYKIKKGYHSNIYELDNNGNELVGWCFIPAGSLCTGDVMLSQKIGLELHEEEALRVANPFNDNRTNIMRGHRILPRMLGDWYV